MRHRPAVRHAGVTLAEMLVVVAIVATTAVLALPRAALLNPGDGDNAVAEVVRALRFAQREALRTGTYQRVSIDPATQVLRVYQADTGNGVTATHPVDKTPYQISFAANAMPRVTIVSAVFSYEGGPTTSFASFGPDGAPVHVNNDKLAQMPVRSGDIDALKGDGVVTLRYGSVDRVIKVAAVTGRVLQ